jgi:hypothetical protein
MGDKILIIFISLNIQIRLGLPRLVLGAFFLLIILLLLLLLWTVQAVLYILTEPRGKATFNLRKTSALRTIIILFV